MHHSACIFTSLWVIFGVNAGNFSTPGEPGIHHRIAPNTPNTRKIDGHLLVGGAKNKSPSDLLSLPIHISDG